MPGLCAPALHLLQRPEKIGGDSREFEAVRTPWCFLLEALQPSAAAKFDAYSTTEHCKSWPVGDFIATK